MGRQRCLKLNWLVLSHQCKVHLPVLKEDWNKIFMELNVKENRKRSPYQYPDPFGEKGVLQEKQGMFILWWNYCRLKSFCWFSLLKSAASFKLAWRCFCCSGTTSTIELWQREKAALKSQSRSSLIRVHCTTHPRHCNHSMLYRLGNVPFPSVSGCWDVLSVALILFTTEYHLLQTKVGVLLLLLLFWAVF